jgi:hemin uptake protein HemP
VCRREGGLAGRRAAQALPHGAPVVESSELFAGRNEVQIHHEGEVYRLRLTKNGKLILNK